MKPVRVLAAARRDIESARNFYDEAQTGLGTKFSRSVAKSLRGIQANPEAMQVIEYGIRRWPVEHFPHGVMYFVGQSDIVVISVFHPRQHPAKWRSRI